MVYTDYAIVTNKMVNNLSCTVMSWVHTVAIIWKCFMNQVAILLENFCNSLIMANERLLCIYTANIIGFIHVTSILN